MTNDPNWTKTAIYYLVIGHACDEDCTPYDVYDSVEVGEFSDGAYRVHYDCLTEKEKQLMEENNK